MQTIHPLEIVFLVSSALIISAGTAAITRYYYCRRIHRVYQDSWRAARTFYRNNPQP
jgi:hypothetical protein